MRATIVVLSATVLAVSACGTTSKPSRPARAAIPDVRGMNAPDAAVRLIKARYCVRLAPGKQLATDERPEPGKFTTQNRMPVEHQAPAAGTTRPAWSMVTLTVGGISAHAATYIDVWDGGAQVPCPPIGVTR